MLWKEISIGFLLAGFIGLLGNDFFNALFIKDAPPAVVAIENVIVGPIIAVLSFVCSVGNVPLAAVLWSGGISFAGVMAFIFADLIVLPIIAAYRKYYGTAFALRITALMFVTMVIAALIVDGLFSALGLIPTGPRPTRADIFGSIELDYKLVLNLIGLLIFAALFWLTARRGTTDPVCGMKVDPARAISREIDGETFYFCSEDCLHAFVRRARAKLLPGVVQRSNPDVRRELFDLLPGSGPETAASRVQGPGGHSEAKRLEHAHAAGQTDSRRGKHGVAGPGVIERLEDRADERDLMRAIVPGDENRRLRSAGDQDIAGTGIEQGGPRMKQARQLRAARIALVNRLALTDPQQIDTAFQSRPERRAGHVRDHVLAIRPQV